MRSTPELPGVAMPCRSDGEQRHDRLDRLAGMAAPRRLASLAMLVGERPMVAANSSCFEVKWKLTMPAVSREAWATFSSVTLDSPCLATRHRRLEQLLAAALSCAGACGRFSGRSSMMALPICI